MKFTEEQITDALNLAYSKAGSNAYFANGFRAGVDFAVNAKLIKAGVLVEETNMEMIYKNWKIEKSDYGFFEAYSLSDCDEYIKWSKSLDDLKLQIDEHEEEKCDQ
jgi:hypothetical protein